jgi:hypothetical protein
MTLQIAMPFYMFQSHNTALLTGTIDMLNRTVNNCAIFSNVSLQYVSKLGVNVSYKALLLA